jgi:putative DNA primase/helicase
LRVGEYRIPGGLYSKELPNLPSARGGPWVNEIRCPFHEDAHPSFGVNLDNGGFHCFGCGAKGGSIVDYTMQRYRLGLLDARRKLGQEWGIAVLAQEQYRTRPIPPQRLKPDVGSEAITPIPATAPEPPFHSRYGKPSDLWTYRDSRGHPLCHVCRFDTGSGKKRILPLTWSEAGWRWKALPPPRPLYNLDGLAANPEALVVVCEGEKAAEATAVLLPHCVTTTPPNGAQSPSKADWSPVKGRRVLVWPDADAPGQAFAEQVASLAKMTGASSVEVLDLDLLARDLATGNPRLLPRGWDAADALAEGWTPEALAAALPQPPDQASTANLPPGFELRSDGLWWRDPSAKARTKTELWVCSALRILAYTRDPDGVNWGRLLEFEDPDGIIHRWAMPSALLKGSGEELRGELLHQGLEISPETRARRLLGDYLQQTRQRARARCVSRTGWFGSVFVLPDRTLGEAGERVVYQSESLERARFSASGTLVDWKEKVAALCVGNSRLCFAVSATFAAFMLEIAQEDGGGFHFRGASSTGKTRALLMAASVLGPPSYMQRWRGTDNGLEAQAEAHNDCLLILDELAQLDPKVAGETAYMLGNGSGKSRADRSGGARAVRRWRLLFLSAGEIGLAEHMAQAGRRIRAGQEARMADIPADTGKFGVFEALHGHPDGAAFARHLGEVAATYYGTAGPAFISELIPKRAVLAAELKRLQRDFIDLALVEYDSPSGQVERVAGRFALVAAAGEFATAFGVTGWPPGEAVRAARACFLAWLVARGGAGNQEDAALLAQVRRFIELNGEAHFTPWERAARDDEHMPRTSNRAGFVDGAQTFFIFREVFRTEVCAGFDHREAARLLVRHGWLSQDSEGNPTRKERLPLTQNPTRVYVLLADKMESSEATDHH